MRPDTSARPTPIYAVASGKGGVGKTSLTANMAYLLAKQGKKVLVMDGDTGLANLDVQLNLKPQRDLGHVIAGTATLDDVVLPTEAGFHLIPGRSGQTNLANLPLAGLHNLVSGLRALSGNYHAVFIDVAAGIHHQALGFCAAADHTLLVTTPDPAALTDAYALVKLLWKDHGIANSHLIINQATAREANAVHGKLQQAAEHFLGLAHLPLLGRVPPCRQFAGAVRLHQLAAVAYPNSPAVEAMANLLPHLPR